MLLDVASSLCRQNFEHVANPAHIKDLYVKPRNLRLALHACPHLESIVFLVLRNAIKKGT